MPQAAAAPIMAQVQFYGSLRERFGPGYPLDVKTPAQAVKALYYVLPGFAKYMQEHSEPGYRVIVGNQPIMADEELHHPAIGKVIRIVPVIAGRAGAGKLIAGVALIGLSIAFPYASATFSSFAAGVGTGAYSISLSSLAFNLGVSMALSGVAQLIAGNPAAPTSGDPANNQPSYSFNGAVNTSAQGNPVAICYGTMLCGSQIISSGLQTEQLGLIQ